MVERKEGQEPGALGHFRTTLRSIPTKIQIHLFVIIPRVELGLHKMWSSSLPHGEVFTGMWWEHLWETVWNNLKCLKRYAFHCIHTALKVSKWGFVKSKKFWNQIKIWTLTSLFSVKFIMNLIWKYFNWPLWKQSLVSDQGNSFKSPLRD